MEPWENMRRLFTEMENRIVALETLTDEQSDVITSLMLRMNTLEAGQ